VTTENPEDPVEEALRAARRDTVSAQAHEQAVADFDRPVCGHMDLFASSRAVEKGFGPWRASSSKHHGSVDEASITKATRSAVLPQ
jgi:hypothetical protein